MQVPRSPSDRRQTEKQHKADSFIETVTNVVIGFLVAMLTYTFIINPLWGLDSSVWDSFGITSVFMLFSILRQYIIRRLFNGRPIYHTSRDYLRRKFHGRSI